MADFQNFLKENEVNFHNRSSDTTTGTSAPEAAQLSQSTFANPSEFLSTLRSILPKVNPVNPNNVTKAELIDFAAHGDNARDTAAASIAAAHYDQLRQIPTVLHDFRSSQGLSDNELALDQAMASGNITDPVHQRQINDAEWAVGHGALAALGAVSTVASAEIPPLSIASGVATAINVGYTGYFVDQALTVEKRAETQSLEDRQMLAGWSEINGGHAAGRQ